MYSKEMLIDGSIDAEHRLLRAFLMKCVVLVCILYFRLMDRHRMKICLQELQIKTTNN